MKTNPNNYHGYRFPPEVISHSVWLYHRFCLGLRDVEELLAKRGVLVTYETIRQWCGKFGPEYARNLKRRQGRLGDIWHLDEVFVKIRGERHYLWRAVDQDGDVIDILVQRYRNARAAKRFFRKLLKGQGSPPWQLVTDKLKSYGAAHRSVMPSVNHTTVRYENNRAEVSHQPTRQRERQMRRFKSVGQAQRFLPVHGVILNFFRFSRHRMGSENSRWLRARAFKNWSAATAA
ncbi:MAG: IS6 family transposase [Gemmatimonadota bacterium]|nr:MAG: IS6 family transposase [Gemmatimonadota bacterium]